jgi:hypothetical protein
MVSAVNDTFNESKGTRTMTLKIDHPGIMWTGEFFLYMLGHLGVA